MNVTHRRRHKHLRLAELVAYFDGLLAGEETRLQAIECHLADCDGCVRKGRAVREWLRRFGGWSPLA